jgi:hypothetical protein
VGPRLTVIEELEGEGEGGGGVDDVLMAAARDFIRLAPLRVSSAHELRLSSGLAGNPKKNP